MPCLYCPLLTSLSPACRTQRTRELPAQPPAQKTLHPARISSILAGSRLDPRSGEDWAGRPYGKDQGPGLWMAPTWEQGQVPLSPQHPVVAGSARGSSVPHLCIPSIYFF